MKSAEQNYYYGFCGYILQYAGVSLKARAWCSWLISRSGAGRRSHQRVAKGDAASIGCGIPLSQEGVLQPGDSLRGRKFYGFGCEVLEKGDSMIADGRKQLIRIKIHRTVPGVAGSVAVSLHYSGIIARNFRIRIYNFFCGRKSKNIISGQINCIKSQRSEAVLNRGILPHGKFGAKILLIPGGVTR